MRVLVTGGAGFIGSHLVRRLADSGHSVTALDNLRRGTLDNLHPIRHGIDFRQADIRDEAALSAAMRGCTTVFHLAAVSNVVEANRNAAETCSVNVEGTVHVLRAAAETGVQRVVFTSSREVYGDARSTPVSETFPIQPKNAYGASKAAGELYCRVLADAGPEITVLRLANVYGAADVGRVIPNFITNALRGEPLVVYGGEQVMDFVYIDVVLDALQQAGFGPFVPGPLNVGSGRGTSILELARRVLQATGSSAGIRVSESRGFEVRHFVADISAAVRLLHLNECADALRHLPTVVDWWRTCLAPK